MSRLSTSSVWIFFDSLQNLIYLKLTSYVLGLYAVESAVVKHQFRIRQLPSVLYIDSLSQEYRTAILKLFP